MRLSRRQKRILLILHYRVRPNNLTLPEISEIQALASAELVRMKTAASGPTWELTMIGRAHVQAMVRATPESVKAPTAAEQ